MRRFGVKRSSIGEEVGWWLMIRSQGKVGEPQQSVGTELNWRNPRGLSSFTLSFHLPIYHHSPPTTSPARFISIDCAFSSLILFYFINFRKLASSCLAEEVVLLARHCLRPFTLSSNSSSNAQQSASGYMSSSHSV